MADWLVRQWSAVGACWLQCPNCLAVSRFDHHELCRLYDPQGTKDTPNPKPHAKCVKCDFVPYLPLELKKTTALDVILEDEEEGTTIWAPVDQATTRVIAETYGTPEEMAQWRSLRPS